MDASEWTMAPLREIEAALRQSTLKRRLLCIGAGISTFLAIMAVLAGLSIDVGVGLALFHSASPTVHASPWFLRSLLLLVAITITCWIVTAGIKLCNMALRRLVALIDVEAHERERPLQAILQLRTEERLALDEADQLMESTKQSQSISASHRL